MATLLRITVSRPVPAGAERVTYKGRPAVRVVGRDGKAAACELTADGTRYRTRSAKWYGQYHDADGVTQQVPMSENKTVAQQMLNELVRKAELARVGIRDPFEGHRATPLTEHLAAWEAVLLARKNTPEYVSLKKLRAGRIIEACVFRHISDISASRVERFLAECRSTRSRFGVQTRNHYLAALKAFGNWLVEGKKATENPFRPLGKQNVAVDVRHQRRPLSPEEFDRLLAVTCTGKPIRGISGPDRAMLYTVAAYTGFRASELASLTPASFALAADPPTVTVAAAHSKHRREDRVPLHPDLLAPLRDRLAATADGQPLWPGNWARHNAGFKLIKHDLAAARRAWLAEATDDAEQSEREASDFLAYRDRDGRTADFHSLRHTFVTNLVRAGVQPKDAMALARHSTITLTMDRYAHVGVRVIPTDLR